MVNVRRLDEMLDLHLNNLLDVRSGVRWLGYGLRVLVIGLGLGLGLFAYLADKPGLAVGAIVVGFIVDLAVDRVREDLDDSLAATERLLTPLVDEDLAHFQRVSHDADLGRRPRGFDLDLET